MNQRILEMYSMLADGIILNKEATAKHFKVSERTIQRELRELRTFLDDRTAVTGVPRHLVYDRKAGGFRVEPPLTVRFSNSEVFTMAKIILESRILCKKEVDPIIEKLVGCCFPQSDRKAVDELLRNERFLYIEPGHKKPLLDLVWEAGQAIRKRAVTRVRYRRNTDGKEVERVLQPVGIMCDAQYFYLIAYFDDEDGTSRGKGKSPKREYPITYRLDRIVALDATKKTFNVPYGERFQEGDFRKRVQFMFTGRLTTVRFWCSNVALEAALDRLPSAQIVKEEKNGAIIVAEVYGEEGIKMWLRSQGDNVKKIKFKTKGS